VWKSTHDGVVASRSIYRFTGIIRREVAHMTGYELLMAVLAIVSAVAGFGCFVVALLNFLKEKNQRK
jgi:hypothetical protein